MRPECPFNSMRVSSFSNPSSLAPSLPSLFFSPEPPVDVPFFSPLGNGADNVSVDRHHNFNVDQ
jgi:hypothetical protein